MRLRAHPSILLHFRRFRVFFRLSSGSGLLHEPSKEKEEYDEELAELDRRCQRQPKWSLLGQLKL